MITVVESWIDALGMYLQDNGVTGLYVGRRSDDPQLDDAAVILTESQGQVAEAFGSGNDVLRPGCNVFVRSEPDDYPGARDVVHHIAWLLPQIVGTTVHGYPFIRVGNDAMQTPTPLGMDSNRRYQWTLDVPTWQPEPTTYAAPTINP